MVDPTKGIGQTPGIVANQPKSAAKPEKTEDKRQAAPGDEIKISEEALSLQQAEKSAAEARAALEKDQELTLGYKQDGEAA